MPRAGPVTPPPFAHFDRLCLAVSHDGATVAAGGEGYQIIVWDARTGAVRAELEEEQEQDIQEQDPDKRHDEVRDSLRGKDLLLPPFREH